VVGPPPAQPLLWETMTVATLRLALRRTRTVLLPLGVTEQHGYHLPLGTDTLCVTEVAKRVSARTGAVVAPPLPYSFSGGELVGTINVSPQTMSLLVQEILSAMVAQGFENIVLLPGHGGSENFAALKDALRLYLQLHRTGRQPVIALAPYWDFSPTWLRWFARGDFHAGVVETALVMALAPHLVNRRRMVTDPPAWLRRLTAHPDNYQRVETLCADPHVVPRVRQDPAIRVGVMGYPERATPALGARIVAEMVTGLAALVRRLETRRARRYRPVKVRRKGLVIIGPGATRKRRR